ncbi:hypothetical protein GCM10009795_040150 [Nocardioides hankookensis]|uniref:Uncharacterized protein n=1 Tax=Nocardioides hankookensis TaxID=443157 RepID=A0ABW1LPQ4_9ACTN
MVVKGYSRERAEYILFDVVGNAMFGGDLPGMWDMLGALPCTSTLPLSHPLHLGGGRGCTHQATSGSWQGAKDKPGDHQ